MEKKGQFPEGLRRQNCQDKVREKVMKVVGFLGWATGWVVDAVPEERKSTVWEQRAGWREGAVMGSSGVCWAHKTLKCCCFRKLLYSAAGLLVGHASCVHCANGLTRSPRAGGGKGDADRGPPGQAQGCGEGMRRIQQEGFEITNSDLCSFTP